MNNKKVEEINITPSTSIYNIFEKMAYEPAVAIAEFIDNSTQSFIDNNKENLDIEKNIFVVYKADKNQEELYIFDNAFGINNDNLEKVLKLNIPSKKENSRNEFGMGLKTAAFWFGKNLNIWTKSIEEERTVNIKMNLNNLNQYQNNIIRPTFYYEQKFKETFKLFDYGTVIQIGDMNANKKLNNSKLKKIVDTISSKYRNDINQHNIKIRFIKYENKKLYDISSFDEGESFLEIRNYWEAKTLKYYEPKLKINPKTNQEYKIIIDDYLNFEDQKYHIHGYIGILEKGSREIAKLVLQRRGRTILGDEIGQYKPKLIFKNSGSFEWQRIYGILNLDDFPVTQQKNNFDWENGLDDEFNKFIKTQIMQNKIDGEDLFKIANKVKSDTKLNKLDVMTKKIAKEIEENINESNSQTMNDIKVEYHEESKEFEINFKNSLNKPYRFTFSAVKEDPNEYSWMIIREIDESNRQYQVILNINTPFFSPFNSDINHVTNQMMIFCIYFAYSEIEHSRECQTADGIRNKLNELLNSYKLL